MSVGAALAGALRSGREEWNRRHAEARHRWPALADEAFREWLTGTTDRVTGAVAGVDAGAVPATVDALYDIGLALLGQRWIGPEGRAPQIGAAFEELAAAAPALLAQAPHALLVALANALVHWQAHADSDPWRARFLAACRAARTPDEALRAGQVAAWVCGLVQYRDSALERVATLDAALLAAVLDIAPEAIDSGMRERLARERWYRPDREDRLPRVAGHLGDFVGYGGRFPQPPLAVAQGSRLVLQSAGQGFEVWADAFGSALHAAAAVPGRPGLSLPAGWRVESQVLNGPGLRFDAGPWGGISSAASAGELLVLTHPLSHAATLIALPAR
jgi:hypothetical protein